MGWLQGHGIAFHTPVYYLSVGPPRIQPVGGGETIVRELTRAAKAAGVGFRYGTTADSLERGATGAITGLRVRGPDGASEVLPADAVVLACGGFQGDTEMLRQHLGPGGESLQPISPGTRLNTGAGIRMGLAAGALAAGDWAGMHIEPIDPRSRNPAAVVLVYPYGIVVDRSGRRFFDEGAGLVHETWEAFARAIHFNAPGRVVYAILDSRLRDIADYQRAIRSEVPPFEAATLAELARLIDVPADTLEATVAAYNKAATGDPARFDATDKDGLAADGTLSPPKSNWARAIERPPFLAYPLIGAIAYTFGGLATDTQRARARRATAPFPASMPPARSPAISTAPHPMPSRCCARPCSAASPAAARCGVEAARARGRRFASQAGCRIRHPLGGRVPRNPSFLSLPIVLHRGCAGTSRSRLPLASNGWPSPISPRDSVNGELIGRGYGCSRSRNGLAGTVL